MAASCFHCGATLPGDPPHALEIDGERRQFCSTACQEVASRIRDGRLTQFYRFRAGPAAPEPGAVPALERWLGYDRPALQEELVVTQADGSHEALLLVQGVRCAACSWLIERAMAAIPGVRAIQVDPLTTRMRLAWDPATVRLSELLARIAALGYEPQPCGEDAGERAALVERRTALRRLIVAGLGMSATMSYAVALYAGAFSHAEPAFGQFLRLVSMLVATPVVFYSGVPFFQGAWRGLRGGRPGMDLPVALAIAAAYAASVWNGLRGTGAVYFDSAVMFVFFLSSARFLEMAGRHRALGLTNALARHLPRIATRLADGRLETVGVTELRAGDLVLVQPGQSMPVDGSLASDAARVDESLLTGESRPVHKRCGDAVIAGSVNLLGAVTLRVERAGAGTLLAQISRLVGVARAERPPFVDLTERVAHWFVVGVLVLAAAVGAAWLAIDPSRAFEVVLALLVVTCPCALALATPAAFTVAMSALARRGVLLRDAGALETLNRVTDLVFDKTGTLTEHTAGIARVAPLGRISADEALALAAALESRSEHPLARAFPVPRGAPVVDEVLAGPGQGLTGRVNGRTLRIGTRAYALELAGAAGPAVTPDDSDDAGPAAWQRVYLGGSEGLLARFDIAERVHPDAAAALAGLRAAGLRIAIASGDQPEPVKAVADQLGIAEWHAPLQPAAKLSLIRAMQSRGGVIGMVGDGINDSPVLAGADVSIAVGSGTALAQHSADCVLIGSRLDVLPEAVALAHRTMHIVRQNLGWAIGYNALAVPLAAAGMLPPWLAALGMSASSLLVTFNALRLGRSMRPNRDGIATERLAPGKATP